MRTTLLFAALAAVLAAPAPLAGQDVNASAGYFALISSPAGALAPVLSSAMLNRPMISPNFAVRYGHASLEGGSLNTYDARLGFPVGTKAMFGVNAGYQDLSCDVGNCDGHFIAGVNAEGRLGTSQLGTGSEAPLLTIGLNGEAGFGKRSDITMFGLTAGLPIALLSESPTMRIAPFLTPAFGWGRVTNNGDSVNGTRFLLGGGVTFQSLTSGVAVNVGFQKIFFDGGETVFGASLVLGGR